MQVQSADELQKPQTAIKLLHKLYQTPGSPNLIIKTYL